MKAVRFVGLPLTLLLVLGACTPTESAPTEAPPVQPSATPVPTEPPAPPETLIAYVDGSGLLCLMGSDSLSAPECITADGGAASPAWSPDGQKLAYLHGASPQMPTARSLFVYDLASQTNQAIAVNIADEWFFEALREVEWSPNGLYLLLDAGTGATRRKVVVDAAAGGVLNDFSTPRCAWAPDGGRLVLGQLTPLDTPISIETGQSLSLAVLTVGQTDAAVILEGTAAVLYTPQAWLPDGRVLYNQFDWDEGSFTGVDSQWTIVIDDPAAAPQPAQDIPIMVDTEAIRAGLPDSVRDNAYGFSWSGDGGRLVFQSDSRIYMYDWSGGGPLTDLGPGTDPAWQLATIQ